MKSQRSRFMLTLAIGLICLVPAASFALTPYSQDFESLIQPLPSALADDGWLVFGNVFNADGSYAYGYGTFPAPNHCPGLLPDRPLAKAAPEQGLQQLSVFNDYENAGAHTNGQLVESNVFQEQTIGPADVGKRWVFQFQDKMGNLAGASTALAFIKTLDPANGYALTNFISRGHDRDFHRLGRRLDPHRHRREPGRAAPPDRLLQHREQLRALGCLLRQYRLDRGLHHGCSRRRHRPGRDPGPELPQPLQPLDPHRLRP